MADISQSSWTETDALNNQAAPLGWTPGTMLPTQVEPTAQAMMGAIKRWWNRQNPIYAATLTTTDTYTVTPQTPVTSFTSFELWRVRMPSANTTTSPTITWGPSAATIQKYSSGSLVNLAVGDIQAQYYEFFFNNTVMVMINPAGANLVSGPASSTSGDIASYGDGSGKLIADSGIAKATVVKNATSSTSQSVPVFTDTSGTVIGNGFIIGTGPSNLVQLSASSKLPAVDGSQLTSLPTLQKSIFTSSGTFTPTKTGTYKITVVGSGGGGGGNTALGDSHAGGGGAGATGIGWQTLTASTGYTVTVGTGGAGGANTGGTGGTGPASSFAGTSTITANGGVGGVGVSAGSTSGSGGGGGTATNGDINIQGGDGESGAGGSSAYGGGQGGASFMGGGSRCLVTGQGQNGNTYGAGGAGSGFGTDAAAHVGGNGSPGVVIAEWLA